MAVRPIDAMELKQRMCALCNQYYSDEPCEPSDCVFVRAINEAPSLTPPNEPRAGLYGKYTVYKNKDGSLVTDCFILRPAKDPAAVAALRAYAAATDNAELAADIINWVGAEPNEWVSVEEGLPEPGERVLAANGSFVGEAYMASNGAWMRHDGFPWEVDAWMPMPDRRPPEGEA